MSGNALYLIRSIIQEPSPPLDPRIAAFQAKRKELHAQKEKVELQARLARSFAIRDQLDSSGRPQGSPSLAK